MLRSSRRDDEGTAPARQAQLSGGEKMKRSLGILLGFAILPLAIVPPAQGADSPGPAYIVTYIEVLPTAANQAIGLIRQLGAASRKESGNVRFEVLQRLHQPSHFAILEVWNDEPAQTAHAAAQHTKDFRAKLQPLLRAPYDERPHTALSVGAMAAGPADGARGAIYAVTHVDVIPKAKDQGVEAVKQLAHAGRKGKDNVRFEALTQSSRPNHMTIVEIWKDQAAIDAHSIADYSKSFRDILAPISGSLYDERFYRTLN